MRLNLIRILTAEFVGTFALVFVGCGAAALGLGGLVGVALAHGLVALAFVYMVGHISGAHINPAVTLSVWAAGKMKTGLAAAYTVTQLIAGVVAAYALSFCLGGTQTGLGATGLAHGLVVGGARIDVTPTMGIAIEAILTLFLALSVLQCAVSGKAGELDGVAIGLTWTFAILMGGPLTGASLNPARSLGPAVASLSFTDLWVYFVGPGLGGAVAALLHRGILDRAS
jgi:MIP family channel proteins